MIEPRNSNHSPALSAALDRACILAHASAPHFYRHLDPRPKPVDNPHGPLNAHAPKIGITNAREVSRVNAGEALRLPDAETPSINGFDDLGGQNRFQLTHVSIGDVQIPVDISASPDKFKLFLFNRNISFSRFSRSFIKINEAPSRLGY